MIDLLILLAIPLSMSLLSFLLTRRGGLELANGLAAFGMLATTVLLALRVFLTGPLSALGNAFYVDALSAFELLIATLIYACVQIYSRGYMGHELEAGMFPFYKLKRYHALLNAFMATFIVVCVANNLGIVWIAIEGTTLTTAYLVAFYNRDASIEAAWKYFFLCTVGISLALMGIFLVYFSVTHLAGPQLEADLNWTTLARIAKQLDPNLLKLSFVFTLIGYGTKVGLAPLHTWLPDAHSEAPSPVSALLSGVLLNGAMYGVIRAHALVVRAVGPGFSNHLLILFGLASLLVAVPFILWQRDFKRLLAYSSVEHMGIIALGLGFGGPLGIFGAMLHTLNHSLLKTSMFFGAGNVLLKYGSREIDASRGLIRTLPVTGPAMLLGAFAIAGAPPFGIFLSELTILTAGFKAGNYVPCGTFFLAIVLIFAGLVNHFGRMALGAEPSGMRRGEVNPWTQAPLIALLLAALSIGIVLPKPLVEVLQQIVAIVQGAS